MTRSQALRLTVLLALAVSCVPSLPALNKGDGGPTDSGPDASTPVDSGTVDGGQPGDSGQVGDSGEPSDSGQPSDGGNACTLPGGGIMTCPECDTCDPVMGCVPIVCDGTMDDPVCCPLDGGGPDSGPSDAGHVDAGCGVNSCGTGNLCCEPTGACFTDTCTVCCAQAGQCTDDSQCGRGTYCASLSCGGAGECQQRPTGCSTTSAPVCGCDGNTYGNECLAQSAGVNIASEGACPVADGGPDAGKADAGQTCTTDSDCQNSPVSAGTMYCAGRGCGTAGTCELEPATCSPNDMAPVCGCDGVTYQTECFAEAAGERVEHNGACGVTTDGGSDAGGTCGNATCGSTETCCEATMMCYPSACLSCCMAMPPPDAGPDAGTTCTQNGGTMNVCARGDFCCPTTDMCTPANCAPGSADCCPMTKPDAGTTDAGPDAGVADAGPDAGTSCMPGGTTSACPRGDYCCATTDKCVADTCNPMTEDCCPANTTDAGGTPCTSNAQCANSVINGREYCAGMGCGTAGTCEQKPAMCLPQGPEVCGCDGMTYENECVSEAAGVRVDYSGACTAADGGVTDAGFRDGGMTNQACMTNTDCVTGDYCNGTGCTGAGKCAVEPLMCTSTLVDPVCGCDGTTYMTPCNAAEVGVRVEKQGMCPLPP